MLENFAYIRPRTVDAALEHLGSGKARIHAGGTDLLDCLRQGVLTANKLVSLRELQELRGISKGANGGLVIGAATTLHELLAYPFSSQRYAALKQAAAEVGVPQLRNQGTLGGNLCQRPRCWYYRGDFDCLRKGGADCYAIDGQNQYHCIFGGSGCYVVHPSDTASALVALGASVQVASSRSIRSVLLEEFYVLPEQDVTVETVLGPNEMLTKIQLPPAPKGSVSSYRKVRERRAWDFALAGVAIALQMEGNRVGQARVVLSGAAPIPWRSPLVEQIITGQPLTQATIGRAVEAVTEGAKPLDHNAYKLDLFRGILREQLEAMAR